MTGPRLRAAAIARWRGEVPMRTALWRDMLGIGTVINLFTGVAALAVLALQGDVRWAVLVHFAPLPLNLLLLRAVFKAPDAGTPARAVAAVWFTSMLVL